MAQRDLRHIGEGFLMGGADIIPGVSGGTVALILGIYERLVKAISHFDLKFLGHLKRREWSEASEHADLVFLGLLGSGIGTGIVLLSGLMNYLLNHQLQHTFAAFFGMILVSSYLVFRMVGRGGLDVLFIGLAGALGAFFLVGLPLLKNPPIGPLYIFGCGVISICAMILPGISGSFILLLLGAYTTITEAVHHTIKLQFDDVGLLLCFAVGAGIGLIGFSKVLRWMLSRFEPQTMALLCGFMLGSLRKVWPYKLDLAPDVTKFKLKELENIAPDFSTQDAWISLGILITAGGLVLLLERIAQQRPSEEVNGEREASAP